MKIKLLNLYIKNFKGIEEKTLNFEGKDKIISGTNEAGKTTVNDAFIWLLNDENSSGDSRFNIKPLDENNNVIHKLNTVVEGVLEIADNHSVTLKKKYYEKWRRKKGSTEETFQGNTTDYYVNNNQMSKTEYENYIAKNIIKVDMLKLLTDPLYFNENLHWKKQRERIFSLADDVDLGEIATKTDTYYLIEEIDNRSLGEYEEVIKGKLKDIDKDIEDIPSRIDEIKKGLSTEGLNENSNLDKLENELETKENKREELQEKIAELKTDNSNKEKIMELREKKQRVKHKLIEKANELLENLREEKRERERQIEKQNDYIEKYQKDINKSNNKRKELSDKLHEWKEKSFSKDDKVCPACNQQLPEDEIEKHRKHFNNEKAEAIKKLNKKINKLNKNIEEYHEKIKDSRDNIQFYIEGGDKYENTLERLKERIGTGKQFKKGVNNGRHIKLEEIQEKIDELKEEDNNQESKKLKKAKNNLSNINEEINELQKKVANMENIVKARKRIKELNEKQEKLMKKYEELEKQQHDVEKMKTEKIKLLEDKVNDMFEITNFKLFKQQQNGKIKETCVALKDGVPFDDMNTGSKYQVGLDIINTLANYYDVYAPVFIDNRERIAKLPKIESQTVHLLMNPTKENLVLMDIEGEEDVQEVVEETSKEVKINQESLF